MTALLLASATAHAILATALAAMGGAQRFEQIHSISYTAVGERQMVEQSERPTGPYFLDHFKTTEIRDLVNRRTRIDTVSQAYASNHWWLRDEPAHLIEVLNGDTSAVVGSDGSFNYAGGYRVEENDDQFDFAPERLLLTAQAAPDLRVLPDETIHGVRHHMLAFRDRGIPVQISINADANLPWQVTYTHAYPWSTFLNPWGDVTTTITYSAWSLEPSGISYPREWTYTTLGLPDRDLFIVDLSINPKLDDATMDVPHAIVAAHPRPADIDTYPIGYGGSGKPRELAPGIMQIPGGWNITLVKQRDGVVMIEAPWSTGYTGRALDVARQLYDLPVKAVITTSDSWPHIAGVREAVARGIPVYALDVNRPILERLLAAPHTMRPDDLARHPRAATFTWVSQPTAIGDGENRLTIYPYRTVTAERQMMVYIAQRGLLYTSDLFSQANGPDDWFTPQYLLEAKTAIDRYGLRPTTVFGMHYDPVPYATIVNAMHAYGS